MPVPKAHVQNLFENLTVENFEVTSCEDPDYNCVAWAFWDDEQWWWPPVAGRLMPGQYWPTPNPSTHPDAFVEAFEILGYVECANGEPEPGFEKVAIFAGSDGLATHAARQLSDGRWASKLGPWVDIEHQTTHAVGGGLYGAVTRFVKREVD